MSKVLSALMCLQVVERQLTDVRGRLRIRRNAANAQQRQIDELRGQWDSINQQRLDRRKEADTLELDLRQREEKVASLRGVLNTAKTNKEYAAVLTEINTIKADNAKLEEKALTCLQEVEDLKCQAGEIQTQIDKEQAHLQEIDASNSKEVSRLEEMMGKLDVDRSQAAAEVPAAELAMFERIAGKLDGDAMAPVEIHGTKPPYSYVCGGCFMSLNAEHANALRTRDEVRTCDSCGRILHLDANAQADQPA